MKVLELFAGTRSIGRAFAGGGHDVYSIEWDNRFPDISWYAKVGRRVFNSLFDAETFCTEHSLDVNSAIEYRDDSELKNNIQTIAQYQKAILQECLDRLKARAEALVQEINRCNADLEKCHPLDRGFLTDRRNEAIAKHTGTMEAREIVAGLKNNLERLTGWHD